MNAQMYKEMNHDELLDTFQKFAEKLSNTESQEQLEYVKEQTALIREEILQRMNTESIGPCFC